MTTDERIDRLENYMATFSERWKTEREEDRALWRDTQRQINLLSRKIADMEDQMLRQQETNQRLHEAAAERDRKLDERVDQLVSAIGAFIAAQQKPE